jgi:hypothetical protein
MNFRYLPWAGACLLLAMSSLVQAAGGPYAVDDTLIAPERGLLLETWYGREDSGTDERVAVINYGWSQRSELSLGLARERDAGESTRLVELGGKRVLTSPASGELGIALAASAVTSVDDDRLQAVEAYVPVDVPVDNGRFVFRYNLGWSHDRDSSDRNAFTWGFGGDLMVIPAMSAIAEIRGSERDRSEVQTGVRFDLGFAAELDVVHGWERRDPDTRWWTVGLALEF